MHEYDLKEERLNKKTLEQDNFKDIYIKHCTHYEEWEAAREFRQKYFFDKVQLLDPYTWTFNHENHAHFVLYQTKKIIGYAHVQLWAEQRAALRIIVIDNQARNQGFGSHFLALCERWLRETGFQNLHTQSSQKAYKFYCKNGYIKMPFDDPDGYESDPQDIDMGKKLQGIDDT